jgi:hypothetical protein
LWSLDRKQSHSFTQMLPCPLPSIPSFQVRPLLPLPSWPFSLSDSILNYLLQYGLKPRQIAAAESTAASIPSNTPPFSYHIVADCARIGGVTPSFDARGKLLELNFFWRQPMKRLLFLKVPLSCWVHSSMSLLKFHLIIGGEWGIFGWCSKIRSTTWLCSDRWSNLKFDTNRSCWSLESLCTGV